MSPPDRYVNWPVYAGICVASLAAVTLLACVTRVWVLTAIPVGFLFGFFLQKGDLCGASAFSEVILMRDARKLWGLWVCVVTGMVGFAVLDLLGWVKLSPKPLIWANQIVGGALFGVGMVLAGGCVSGSLFKAGIGHLNSMIALPAIALGVAAVEHGPLRSCHAYMKTHIVKTADGGPVTVASLTGLPFWALAAMFAVLTLLAGLAIRRRKRAVTDHEADTGAPWSRVLTARSWKPWQSGVGIGILGALAYLSSAASGRNYPLGVTHGVLHIQLLVTDSDLKHVWRRPSPQAKVPASQNAVGKAKAPRDDAPRKKVSWWLVAAVVSLIVGSWVAAKLSGSARLLPKPPDQVIVAFIGGLLVGAGAAFARGCVVGNIMSGWALMSVGTVLFGVVAMLANWAATYFYIMGGMLFDRGE